MDIDIFQNFHRTSDPRSPKREWMQWRIPYSKNSYRAMRLRIVPKSNDAFDLFIGEVRGRDFMLSEKTRTNIPREQLVEVILDSLRRFA